MPGAGDIAVNKTNPYYYGAYTPIWKTVTKGRQISNIFLDSVKCYEKYEEEKRQYGGGQC